MAGRNRYYTGPITDHFDGNRFFNPGVDTDRSLADLWRWRRGEKPASWPRSLPGRRATPDARIDGLRVTAIGHSSVLIQLHGRNILVDPIWSDRASPVRFAGPKRASLPGIAFDDLPPIDAVLITHSHYDHLDRATLRRLQAVHRPCFVMPLGNDAIVRRWLPAARVEVGDWGDRVELGDGIAVHLVPAQHWSARRLGDRRMALWCGFVVEASGRTVYVVGDSGYGDGTLFRDIRDRFGAPDLAVIPIGAYAPRWFMAAQHMDPEEAVRVFEACGARRAIGVHWATFQLTNEAWDEPRQRLAEALARRSPSLGPFVAAMPGDVTQVD